MTSRRDTYTGYSIGCAGEQRLCSASSVLVALGAINTVRMFVVGKRPPADTPGAADENLGS